MGRPVEGWAGFRAGPRMRNPRRISPAAGVRQYPRRSPPAKCLFYCAISAVLGWLPERVASQKSGPVASDVPRCAPQHTFSARKEPENNDLAARAVIWLRLDPGSDSGVHQGIHPETDCASCLQHAPLPSISNSYPREMVSVSAKTVRRTLSHGMRRVTRHWPVRLPAASTGFG